MEWILKLLLLLLLLALFDRTSSFRLMDTRVTENPNRSGESSPHKHAYATMMYMGTPRDYEFYVATRVLIRSLSNLQVDADLIVIASMDVPLRWVAALEEEDGAKVVRVANLRNPYQKQTNFDRRFKLTMNKLYAWNLVDYERVVMLDADNLFLRKADELFQCGEFCAVFINPCIFHTGLFVLKPSKEVFAEMMHGLEAGMKNDDGADQGFLAAKFPDLLDKPLFHPASNGTKLVGQYRLPLGYQMDATYFYLRLRWNVPCGPNSVITFPGAHWLKPWYWWAWPVLPLGLQWHEQRRDTLGYGSEMPLVLLLSVFYLGVFAVSRLARPNITKLCHRRTEKATFLLHSGLKVVAIWCMLAAYLLPFFIIPCTIHPLIGWAVYLLGSLALTSIVVNVFMLPWLPAITPWLGILGALMVMAYPWYPNGIIRALSIFGYAFCCSPFVWWTPKVVSSMQFSVEREAFLTRIGDLSAPPGSNKLY